MSKWIQFYMKPRPADKKTDTFTVIANDGGVDLGEVKFYGAWRKFCFFPNHDTVFEQDCLRDIAIFCEQQTAAWRASKRVA